MWTCPLPCCCWIFFKCKGTLFRMKRDSNLIVGSYHCITTSIKKKVQDSASISPFFCSYKFQRVCKRLIFREGNQFGGTYACHPIGFFNSSISLHLSRRYSNVASRPVHWHSEMTSIMCLCLQRLKNKCTRWNQARPRRPR
jgi:hypothetical protein